jgi:REP element-mobilizing transposase RayT
MARSIRIEYPGALYHVMARGNRREAIYRDDDDRRFFLSTLAQSCERTGWRVHAWVLMSNHYHLLISTPEPNLVAGMKWLQLTYTQRFNLRHRLWGRLFGDRYKAIPVEGAGFYYETLLDYIHLNPIRARIIKPSAGQSILDYPWSSVAGGIALLPSRRPRWLAASDALAAFACPDTARGRRQWVQRLDRIARTGDPAHCGIPDPPPDTDARLSTLQRGWYWGTQAFAERLLTAGNTILKHPRNRAYKAASESRAHNQRQAQRLLQQALHIARLRPIDLNALPGSDPRKAAIAELIRSKTTVSMAWLSDHLAMRSPANTSQQIRRQQSSPRPIPKPLKTWIAQSRNVT